MAYDEVLCPDCGGKMISKHGKNGIFWGCKDYPRCTGTRNAEAESREDRGLPSDRFRNNDRVRWSKD